MAWNVDSANSREILGLQPSNYQSQEEKELSLGSRISLYDWELKKLICYLEERSLGAKQLELYF